ncbi:DUF1127 domain-containing protein [Rhodobacterales bacterium LSUCC0246]|nr:DUF1127 domain-containing protein [Rhodobacterales bacterium LSUCC0374]
MAYLATRHAPSLSFFERLGEIKCYLTAAIKASRVYQRTFDELNSLSDRELADLGVARSNLRNIALEAAYGRHA